jgi:hypothetical protein
MLSRSLLLAALLLSLAVPAGAQKEKDKPKVYKTPQEVFDAFVTAVNKNDHKTRIACYPPVVQKKLATDWAIQGVFRRSQADSDGKIKGVDYKPLFEVLDKHGLTEKATKGITGLETGKKRIAARSTLIGLVKDHAAFVADYEIALAAVTDKGRPREKDKAKQTEVRPKLTEVKIDGDKATGVPVLTIDGKEKKGSVDFVKVGDGWRIIPDRRLLDDSDKPENR